MDKYCQCELRRDLPTAETGSSIGGSVREVAWIPKKFAVKGSVLQIREADEWVDGWVVVSVGAELPENLLPDTHKAVRAHRKATGDSLAKGA